MRNFACPIAVFFLCLRCAAYGAVVYVDKAASGTVHDGRSWATAYTTIQAAVNACVGGDIWVKAGVYTEQVTLKHAVNLYGGFLGHETSASQRLPGAFPTIIDGKRKWRVIDVPLQAWCTIDGLTIRRGFADTGAGVRCNTNAIVKLRNCRIEDCVAWQQAGGVYYGKYTQGEMTDCVVTRCSAPIGGGGVVEYHSYPTWTRCVLTGNHASTSGGAVYCPFHSGALLENCTLVSNTAGTSGGAVYAYYGGPVTLNYCILANNSAPEGGAVYGGGGSSQTTLSHCDFHGNTVSDFGGALTIPSPSLGNTYLDPRFVMPNRDDYHLSPDSPCAGQGAFECESSYVVDRIGVAKMLAVGSVVRMASKVVGFVDGETVYVQEPDRAAAIPVQGLSGFQQGDLLSSVSGTLMFDASGRASLVGGSATLHARGVFVPRPLGMESVNLARHPGVLARTWGRVGAVDPSGFTLLGAAGQIPVRYAGAGIANGAIVSVTGVYTATGEISANRVITYP